MNDISDTSNDGDILKLSKLHEESAFENQYTDVTNDELESWLSEFRDADYKTVETMEVGLVIVSSDAANSGKPKSIYVSAEMFTRLIRHAARIGQFWDNPLSCMCGRVLGLEVHINKLMRDDELLSVSEGRHTIVYVVIQEMNPLLLCDSETNPT